MGIDNALGDKFAEFDLDVLGLNAQGNTRAWLHISFENKFRFAHYQRRAGS